ncbi:MAG: hypothetical protein K0U98_07850 [Deltaproteobacteria bacterium]|nr:hypothetical protein [Deltaproteobacteria bacterium]
MKSERFFTFIQRVNSLFLFVVGLVVLGLLIGTALESILDLLRPKPAKKVVQVHNEETPESSLFFGSFDRLPGTDILWSPVLSSDGYPSKLSSKGSRETRNYLFFDLEAKRSSWLVDGNEQVFSWYQVATVEDAETDSSRAIALLFLVISEDSDGDGRLTEDDEAALALADPTGQRMTTLLSGVERIDSFEVFSPSRGFLFLVSGGSLKVAELDLERLEILSIDPLPSIPLAGGKEIPTPS